MPEERFISLLPPTPHHAGKRFLAFLLEELAERGKAETLLAVYATQEGSSISLWTFFATRDLAESGPELESVHDAEVKIKAGYFIPTYGQPPTSIDVQSFPVQARTLQELEAAYFAGNNTLFRIYPPRE